ncbi:hypothetical protein I2486_09080 [Cellulophaga sp. E16_2]|uniref:Uncharacterized protein n=1 Tax=Cellulophaga algicola (strain DSM 14237 / IC166 / ACAM 630) TaxID=688270 RepID=E6XDI3_CELAD|nr:MULTISPECIES: hypothetical protein [Cellulophaga]ADV49115.1 hypothetical protein Celal_1814 [Cellulophaga algicola DSM 14237]MBO0591561.1 hypothetical protein [Cellulophaga sp. E16_2]
MNQNNYKYQTNSRVGNVRSALDTSIDASTNYTSNSIGDCTVNKNIEQTD